MSDEPQKQMLYLSIEEYQGSHYIRFEIEPYYSRKSRHIHTECRIDIFDVSILLREDDLKEELGFWLVLELFIRGTSPLREKPEKWYQIVYPHHRGQQAVLRIDEEVYQFKPSRKFCGRLLLPSMAVEKVDIDESFKRTLAEHVLQYLPISKEFCMNVDT